MAIIGITDGNVKLSDGGVTSSNIQVVTYGATVTKMDILYSDSSDSNKYKPCDNSTAAAAQAIGFALTQGGDGDQGIIVKSGAKVIFGGTLAPGETYYVSSTTGAIEPGTDLSSNDYITQVGIALTTTELLVNIEVTGEQKP
jgi:hypothetical protein